MTITAITLAVGIIAFLVCLKLGYVNVWMLDKNVRTIKNYCKSSFDARQLYNATVNYFEANSDKLQCIKVKYNYWKESVTVKYKSLDNKTVFTFDMVSSLKWR